MVNECNIIIIFSFNSEKYVYQLLVILSAVHNESWYVTVIALALNGTSC